MFDKNEQIKREQLDIIEDGSIKKITFPVNSKHVPVKDSSISYFFSIFIAFFLSSIFGFISIFNSENQELDNYSPTLNKASTYLKFKMTQPTVHPSAIPPSSNPIPQ